MSLISDNGISGYLKSRFKSYAWGLNAEKVSKGTVSSEISLEEGLIEIKGNRLIIDTDNFKINADNSVEIAGIIKALSGGNIGKWDISLDGLSSSTPLSDTYGDITGNTFLNTASIGFNNIYTSYIYGSVSENKFEMKNRLGSNQGYYEPGGTLSSSKFPIICESVGGL